MEGEREREQLLHPNKEVSQAPSWVFSKWQISWTPVCPRSTLIGEYFDLALPRGPWVLALMYTSELYLALVSTNSPVLLSC